MKQRKTICRTWKVFYYFGEKVTLKSDARFGVLAFDSDAIRITGDDTLIYLKHDVERIDVVTVPVAVPAIRVRTKAGTIILGREWFHVTRHMVFAWFLGDLRKGLLAFSHS